MRALSALLILSAALVAAVLGLVASVALLGPGPLLQTRAGQAVADWLWSRNLPAGLRVVEPGDVVPPFSLPGLGGPDRQLPRPGRPLLINYWASWCGPCREELPLLDAFAAHATDGVEVVAIALDERADAEAFLRRHPLALTVLLEAPGADDSSVRVGDRNGVLPYSVLIDAEGRLVRQRAGAFRDAQELRQFTKLR